MRDIIDTPQGLSIVSINSERAKLTQSGLTDSGMLCGQHEQATQKFDKYGIEFCRAFHRKAEITKSGRGFIVPNPKPDMLANFVYACVWRYVMSTHGAVDGLKLGRYEAILRGCLFDGDDCLLPVIVGMSHLRDEHGEPQRLCIPPFYSRAAPANRWVFTVGYLDFMVFCDSRPIAHKLAGGLANRDNPLLCGKTDGQLFTESHVLQPLIRQIAKQQRPR